MSGRSPGRKWPGSGRATQLLRLTLPPMPIPAICRMPTVFCMKTPASLTMPIILFRPSSTPADAQGPPPGQETGRAGQPVDAEQRLLILDAWQRSGLPARDFAPWSASRHTLYAWKKKFEPKARPA